MITTELIIGEVWVKISVSEGDKVTIQDSTGYGYTMYAFTEVDSQPIINEGHLLGDKNGIEFLGDGVSFLWMKVKRGTSKVVMTK